MLRATLVSLAAVAGLGAVLAAEPAGTFGIVADIHFDPFDPESLAEELGSTASKDWMARIAAADQRTAPRRGSDTDHVLLLSALSAISRRMTGADLVIVAGDLLSHRFGDTASKSWRPQGPGSGRAFAHETAHFVIDALSGALPGKPVLVALGNNDSSCGDYAIEPGGDFLAATMKMVEAAVGADLLTVDFEKTYRAGGYYEVRHPTVRNAKILVLNDVMWSRNYENRCGSTGLAEARNQLEWLKTKLVEQSASGGIVWIVHHIPWGIDAYSTLQSQSDRCEARVVPFLRGDVSDELFPLIRRHARTIAASFSAHTHYDDFRLLPDDTGAPVIVDKLVPAISPIFGQDPGFQVFTYDVASGRPLDYTSYHLANLNSLSSPEAGVWRERYVFSRISDGKTYSPEAVNRLSQDLRKPGPARELYYDRRKTVSDDGSFLAYGCAIAHVDSESYARCHCGPSP